MNAVATVTPFQYGDTAVRIIDIKGEPWFVASDVARVLEYREAHDVTRRLDSEDKGPHPVRTPGGVQHMVVISEPGFYAAILGSRSEKARDVKRWLTHEVLPAIRKTGSYGTAPALTEDEIVAQALAI
ncbi:Bro-N domain-containing protein, partial [Rhodococcus pyridinivorans]|nr:Bro-N domain-containing protein [Rhodococcus pyridinivorans]